MLSCMSNLKAPCVRIIKLERQSPTGGEEPESPVVLGSPRILKKRSYLIAYGKPHSLTGSNSPGF